MENFLITISLLLLGMVLKRLPSFPAETGNVLNMFVIYISLPALVLLKIPELVFSRSILTPALLPWGMLFFSALLIGLLARLAHWDRGTTGCLLLLIPLGNTSFLGIPMVQAFFGAQAIPYALIYDQLGSFLALATYGSLILALYGGAAVQPNIMEVVKKVIFFPPFMALLLALLWRPFSYPAAMMAILRILAATLVPVVMIAVGFQLSLRLPRKVMVPLGVGLTIKLLIAPFTALLVIRLLGLSGEASQVAIFEAGMPPMVSAGALAILANLSPHLTAALVGVGIVLSFATLPLLYQFLV